MNHSGRAGKPRTLKEKALQRQAQTKTGSRLAQARSLKHPSFSARLPPIFWLWRCLLRP